MLRVLALLALAGGLLVVAGCGSDSDSTSAGDTTATMTTEESEEESEEEDEEESTPAQALAEIATIRALLDDAVAQYASGDHSGAADAVGDIYLEHYEHVEGPLGDVNHDLMEDIEEKLSTDLRTSMQDGAEQSEIDALVAEITSGLDQAEEELS
jgi:hypothetical protein